MEYAIQLFLPILGGLLLGNWLHNTYGASHLWTLGLAVVGMLAGLGVLYKRQMYGSTAMPKMDIKTPEQTGKASTLEEEPKKPLSHEELMALYKNANETPPSDEDDFALGGLLSDDDDDTDTPSKN